MKIDTLWGSRLDKAPAEGLLAFTSGRDVTPTPPYDERLIPYDIWGSKAHVIMLWRQGLLGKREVRKILRGLDEIETLYLKGEFKVTPAHEDVHSAIESYLIEHYRMEIAGRLHAGRSRNDQVAVDMRLYLREENLNCTNLLLNLIDVLLEVAGQHLQSPMPGYTHHQPAMITSFGHLLFSYAVALERNVERFIHWYSLFNVNPLGSAAGYGSSLPLDRELTSHLLGFDSVQDSSLDPVQNRWEPELEMVYILSVAMNHLSSLAQTLLILGTSEFGLIRLDDAYCTGSSLMPQKRNPDPLEVIKGKTAYVHGMLMVLLSLGKSSFAGYNRDFQWSKYPVMDVLAECKPAMMIMKELLVSLTFHKERALKRCEDGFIAAADVVEWLVERYNLPFREAKIVVEKAVRYAEEQGSGIIAFSALQRSLKERGIKVKVKARELEQCQDPEQAVKMRKTAGGPSPETVRKGMKKLEDTLNLHRGWLAQQRKKLEQAQAEVEEIIRSLG